jgi:ferrous iron transport protein A
MGIKDFEIGDRLRVAGYESSGREYRQKLLSMGLVRGAEFEITRRAPLGDPVEIRLGSFSLTLRRDEAAALRVEKAD